MLRSACCIFYNSSGHMADLVDIKSCFPTPDPWGRFLGPTAQGERIKI